MITLTTFDHSVILPRHCPGMGVFDQAPGAELADIVQDLHATGVRIQDLMTLLNLTHYWDKRLLDIA